MTMNLAAFGLFFWYLFQFWNHVGSIRARKAGIRTWTEKGVLEPLGTRSGVRKKCPMPLTPKGRRRRLLPKDKKVYS